MPKYGCFLIFLQIYLATVLVTMDVPPGLGGCLIGGSVTTGIVAHSPVENAGVSVELTPVLERDSWPENYSAASSTRLRVRPDLQRKPDGKWPGTINPATSSRLGSTLLDSGARLQLAPGSVFLLLGWRRLLLPGLLLGRGLNRRGPALRNVRLWLESRNGLLALLVTAGARGYPDRYIARDMVEAIFAGITPLDASGDAGRTSVVGVGSDLNQLLLCRVHVINRVADSRCTARRIPRRPPPIRRGFPTGAAPSYWAY